MAKKNSIQYDKLIRDKIPEIIEAHGKKAVVEVLDQEGFETYLNRKLSEELMEYHESGSVEELADLVEVVYALLECKGVTPDQFEEMRQGKVEARGAFRKRLVLKEVVE